MKELLDLRFLKWNKVCNMPFYYQDLSRPVKNLCHWSPEALTQQALNRQKINVKEIKLEK